MLYRLIPDFGAHTAAINVGGAEANVAVALGNWGLPVMYVSRVPDNSIAESALEELRRQGVNTKCVIKGGDRLGFYYLVAGADLKSNAVVYDRAYSSFSELKPGDIPWKEILHDVEWLHFSAITPALSVQLSQVCEEAVLAARQMDINVSVDLNYRPLLWKNRDPLPVMSSLLSHCNVVMGNLWSANKLLGIAIPSVKTEADTEYFLAAEQSARSLQERFPLCRQVAYTFRMGEGEEIRYFGTLYDNGNLFKSPVHTASRVTDRVGTGDSFMAGLIYGYMKQLPSQECIDFAARCGFNKFFVEGDFNTTQLNKLIH